MTKILQRFCRKSFRKEKWKNKHLKRNVKKKWSNRHLNGSVEKCLRTIKFMKAHKLSFGWIKKSNKMYLPTGKHLLARFKAEKIKGRQIEQFVWVRTAQVF